MTIKRPIVACFAVLLVIAAVAAILSGPVVGMPIDVSLDPKKFGRLDQTRTNCPTMNCGPTAAVNSFVYLQNMFPGTYKVPLVPAGKEIDVANTLNGKNFMNTCCVEGGGTSIADFILGKMAYLEQQNKAATRYKAQMSDEWNPPGHPGVKKPTFVQDNIKPTVAFIADELKAGEDVELALKPLTGPGHYVTLTGITFDTETGTGTISFVDPMGGMLGKAGIMRGSGENASIVTDYMIGNQVTRVVGAVAESPVPEPTTLLLVGTTAAGIGLARWRQRRRKQQP
jgi:hypothetical protein